MILILQFASGYYIIGYPALNIFYFWRDRHMKSFQRMVVPGNKKDEASGPCDCIILLSDKHLTASTRQISGDIIIICNYNLKMAKLK